MEVYDNTSNYLSYDTIFGTINHIRGNTSNFVSYVFIYGNTLKNSFHVLPYMETVTIYGDGNSSTYDKKFDVLPCMEIIACITIYGSGPNMAV